MMKASDKFGFGGIALLLFTACLPVATNVCMVEWPSVKFGITLSGILAGAITLFFGITCLAYAGNLSSLGE
jgi:hypothetical protein